MSHNNVRESTNLGRVPGRVPGRVLGRVPAMLGGRFLWKSREMALIPAAPATVLFFLAHSFQYSPRHSSWEFGLSQSCSRWPSFEKWMLLVHQTQRCTRRGIHRSGSEVATCKTLRFGNAIYNAATNLREWEIASPNRKSQFAALRFCSKSLNRKGCWEERSRNTAFFL